MTEMERAHFFIKLICSLPDESHVWDGCGADCSGTEAADELYAIFDELDFLAHWDELLQQN